MKRHEREALLDRVDREAATVGASIPERLAVRDEEVDLRADVIALRRGEALAAGHAEDLRTLTVALRRERSARLDRLAEAPIDREEGERLAESIVGIDRALEVLGGVGADVDIEAEMQRAEVADKKRWRKFIERTTGGIDRGRDR